MALSESELHLLYTILARADLGDLQAVQLTVKVVLIPAALAGMLPKKDPGA